MLNNLRAGNRLTNRFIVVASAKRRDDTYVVLAVRPNSRAEDHSCYATWAYTEMGGTFHGHYFTIDEFDKAYYDFVKRVRWYYGK